MPMPCGSIGLRCLLCNKWVSEEALHGGEVEGSSKDHKNNLAGFDPRVDNYHQSVTLERIKWHPETLADAKIFAPRTFNWDDWLKKNPLREAPPPPPPVYEEPVWEGGLPYGWYVTSDDNDRDFYYTRCGLRQYQVPTLPVYVPGGPIPPPPPPEEECPEQPQDPEVDDELVYV